MGSLTTVYRLPQLRCLALPGGDLPAPYRYERRIAGRWVPCNHSRAVAIVGVVNRRLERGGAK